MDAGPTLNSALGGASVLAAKISTYAKQAADMSTAAEQLVQQLEFLVKTTRENAIGIDASVEEAELGEEDGEQAEEYMFEDVEDEDENSEVSMKFETEGASTTPEL